MSNTTKLKRKFSVVIEAEMDDLIGLTGMVEALKQSITLIKEKGADISKGRIISLYDNGTDELENTA
jgi:hypothetical protein